MLEGQVVTREHRPGVVLLIFEIVGCVVIGLPCCLYFGFLMILGRRKNVEKRVR